jgi:hypothetical protein
MEAETVGDKIVRLTSEIQNQDERNLLFKVLDDFNKICFKKPENELIAFFEQYELERNFLRNPVLNKKTQTRKVSRI